VKNKEKQHKHANARGNEENNAMEMAAFKCGLTYLSVPAASADKIMPISDAANQSTPAEQAVVDHHREKIGQQKRCALCCLRL